MRGLEIGEQAMGWSLSVQEQMDMYRKGIRALKSENDSLRKFVQAVAEDVFGGELFDCGGCRFFRGCYNGEEREHEGRGCQWWLWARELGIEAEDDKD